MTSTEDMKLTTTKYIFLVNVTNKQNFIDMPSRYLQLEGCVTHHAHGDADLFSKQDATIYDVVAAGDAALVCRYNGKDGDNLDALKFCSKVATNGARKHCPRLLRRLSFTASAYTCRYNSGCVSAI